MRDLKTLVGEEITQRRDEGCDVAGFVERLEAARNDADRMAVYDDLQKLSIRPDFPYIEPSDLPEIRAESAGKWQRRTPKLDDKLFDRVHGAWLGRCAGCMLGKPVECWPWDHLKTYLEYVGEYPLTNYIPPPPNSEKIKELVDSPLRTQFCRGNFTYSMIDDDTSYTVLALKMFEERGPEFSTGDVGWTWLRYLPYNRVWTAEKQAYANLMLELPLEQVPTFLNPYREWIGAQIRADFWGYCTPGWPAKAAEFAHRDASLSHVKNGIYGEMACAAMISAALVTDDVFEIIDAGLDVIPAKSRLAETIADCLRWKSECATWEEAFARMLETYYGKYNCVHTNNNFAICLIAMLYGWPDYENVVCTAVMQGMDTDCTAATVGSIIGAALGAKAIPGKWIDPLNGLLATCIQGYDLPRIEDLAADTMKAIERVREV